MIGTIIGLSIAVAIGIGMIVATGIQIAKKTIKTGISAIMLCIGFAILFVSLFTLFSKIK